MNPHFFDDGSAAPCRFSNQFTGPGSCRRTSSVRANLSDKNIFQKNSIRQHISLISDKNSEEQQHKKTIFWKLGSFLKHEFWSDKHFFLLISDRWIPFKSDKNFSWFELIFEIRQGSQHSISSFRKVFDCSQLWNWGGSEKSYMETRHSKKLKMH